MDMLRNMSLGTRFNLILILIFIALFTFNGVDDYYRQHALIRQDAVDISRMMARQIIETRSYLSSVLRNEASANHNLIPQVASTRIAAAISKGSRYTLRQTSLRYRNPDNRPDPYEAEILKRFKERRAGEHYEIIKVDGKEILRYLYPMAADQSCLECHGTYESAPEFVQRMFPKGHFSYDYRVGEVIGAISVSVPMSDLYDTIGRNLKTDLLVSSGIVLLILLLTGTLIRRFIIAPVSRLSETLAEVSRTGAFNIQLPVTGNDEISRLMLTYNAMIKELNDKGIQRQEAEERYRHMIEMARSAIVTFIMNGKIVIANQAAERLFAMQRSDLIGTDFFGFVVDGEALRRELEQSIASESQWEGLTVSAAIRDIRGHRNEVELAISATMSGGSPMITAIIRETPDATH